jgi:putative proteasome-type protease
MIVPRTPLDEAAKCALVSMDSTLKSNLSVGLPIDLLVYREGSFQSEDIVCIDEANPYFAMVRDTWGQRLRDVFRDIDNPEWAGREARFPLRVGSERYDPLSKIRHPGEKIV